MSSFEEEQSSHVLILFPKIEATRFYLTFSAAELAFSLAFAAINAATLYC
jgi:hypothetical protein